MTDYIIKARGIGEPFHGNMLDGLRKYLPTELKFEEVNYPSQYGPVPKIDGKSFYRSLDIGLDWLEDRFARSKPDDRFIVTGYSAGAELIGNFVASTDQHNLNKILGAYLVADPSMPKLPGNRKFGIRGERFIHGVNVKWAADPKDVIPLCSPPWSPLRAIADASPGISLGVPMGPAEAIQEINRRRPQAAIGLFDASKAFQEAYGYLIGGDHTGYKVRRQANGKTYIHNGADWILGLL